MKSGMEEPVMPARLWNSVRTQPGSSAVTCTPVPCSSTASDSVMLVA